MDLSDESRSDDEPTEELHNHHWDAVIPNSKKPTLTTEGVTATQIEIQKKLEGLPGGLQMSEEETKKYFGGEARDNFFERYKWLGKQIQITQSAKDTRLKSLYFNDDNNLVDNMSDEFSVEGSFGKDKIDNTKNSHSKHIARKKHLNAVQSRCVNDYAFAPKRLHYDLAEKDIEYTEAIRSRLNLPSQEKHLPKYPALYVTPEQLILDKELQEKELKEKEASLQEVCTLESGITTAMNTFDVVNMRGLDMDAGVVDDDSVLSDDMEMNMEAEAEALGFNKPSSTSKFSNRFRESIGVQFSDKVSRPSSASAILARRAGRLKSESAPTTPQRGPLPTVRAPNTTGRPTSAFFSKLAEKSPIRPTCNPIKKSPVRYGTGKISPLNLNPAELTGTQETKETLPNCNEILDILAVPNSPRTNYLVGCKQDNVLPRPSLVIRKLFSKDLNLQHQGMGDQMAYRLAESLRSLPYIESLNIVDNNLSCEGLCAIFDAIRDNPNLLSLDIAENNLGPDSATALSNYLISESCPLVKLGLNHADVDDYECERFVGSISQNKTLREVDMSHNKLGQLEALNAVMPDVVTGGEAIAELFTKPTCLLESVNLSWNMIRLGGAVDLANSLAKNKHLTHLDLSYNALSNVAGVALGDAIVHNTTLKILNICSNGIDESACLTICQGIILNTSLTDVILDGNPIGEMGVKALMLIPLSIRAPVRISAVNCNVSIKDPQCMYTSPLPPPPPKTAVSKDGTPPPPLIKATQRFDINNPVGKYELQLSNPFHRAMALSLMDVVVRHQSFIFSKIAYSPNAPTPAATGKKAHVKPKTVPWEAIELVSVVSKEREKHLTTEQAETVAYLRHSVAVTSNVESCVAAYEKAVEDEQLTSHDGDSELDRFQFHRLLLTLGLHRITQPETDDIVKRYDLDGGGTIGMDEYLLFLSSETTLAENRLRDLLSDFLYAHKSKVSKAMLNDAPYSVKWIPPKVGVLIMEVVDGLKRKRNFKILSEWDVTALQGIARSTPDVVNSLAYALKLVKFRLAEGISLFRFLFRTNTVTKVKLAVLLLPCIDSPVECRRFLSVVTDDDRIEMQQVKKTMGQSIRIFFATYDGYYCLDMREELDRLCLYRLVELSKSINMKRRKACPFRLGLVGDTSQHGNWSCFRNELFNHKPFEITPEKVTPAPLSGLIEFDFVAGFQPEVTDVPMLDRRFLTVLTACCLLLKDSHIEKMHELKYMKILNDNSISGDGFQVTHVIPEEKRLSIFQSMEKFYDSLEFRHGATVQGLVQEEIKVDYLSNDVTAASFLKPAADDSDSAGNSEKNPIESSPVTSSKSKKSAAKKNNKSVAKKEKKKEKLSGVEFSDYVFDPKDADLFVVHVPERMKRRNHAALPTSITLLSAMLRRSQEEKQELRAFKKKQEKIKTRRANFKKMLIHPEVPPHAKASRVCEALEEHLAGQFITCRQLGVLFDCFPQGGLWKSANSSGFSKFGTYRVELLITLMYKIVDLYNLDIVTTFLSAEEMACLTCRVGWFNGIFNPLKPEGPYFFNISRHVEDRQLVKCFAALSVIEPGENWLNEKFRWSLSDSDPWIPGWECSSSWMTESSLTTKGFVCFTYCSGPGGEPHMPGDGFFPTVAFRKALCHLTILDERSIVPDEERAACMDEYTLVNKDHPEKGTKAGGQLKKPPGVLYMLNKQSELFRTYLCKHPPSTYEVGVSNTAMTDLMKTTKKEAKKPTSKSATGKKSKK